MNAIPQMRHTPAWDGIRGLAVLLVLIGHLELNTFANGNGLQYAGPIGVEIFFLLSGFLITGLLVQERRRFGQIDLSEFYKRRLLRLAPAALVYLVFALLLFWSGVDHDSRWYSFVAALLYARNLVGRGDITGHYWSLSAEEQFYTVWPFAMRKLGIRTLFRLATGGAVAITLVRTVAIAFFAVPDYKTFYRPWYRCDAILLGCAIALWHFGGLSTEQQRSRLCRWLPLGVTWPLLLFWMFSRSIVGDTLFLTGICGLSAAAVTPLFVGEAPLQSRFFSHPWLRYLGKISYSLYLWQQPFVGSDIFKNSLGRFPVSLLATIGCALASYYFVERPFLIWKERRKQKREQLQYSRPAVA